MLINRQDWKGWWDGDFQYEAILRRKRICNLWRLHSSTKHEKYVLISGLIMLSMIR